MAHPATIAVIDQFASPPIDMNDPVDRVVVEMYADITDRRGWRQEWDGFDPDIKASIIAAWRNKVRTALAS